MVRHPPPVSAARMRPVASTGSDGIPSARVKTFALPPGTVARAGRVSGPPAAGGSARSSPLTASFTVPSPPSVSTSSQPSRAASPANWAA
jgi:hypothetical protein